MKKELTMGHSDITINRVGLGCMGMSEFYGPSDDEISIQVLRQALDEGVNFFDTADMYGIGHNEKLIGKAFAGKWGEVTLATKFGIRRDPHDGSRMGICGKPEYVKNCCDASLQRLGIETIDLFYMHRLDPNTPIEDTVGAMKELVEAGKVRYLGVSEVNSENLKRAHAVHPISALQTEFSMWTREARSEVFSMCKELGVTFVGYSPLGRGFLTGKLRPENLDADDWRHRLGERFQEDSIRKNQAYLDLIHEIATNKGVSSAQIALAWVLHQFSDIAVIPGTRKISRVLENLAALDVSLSQDELELVESRLPDVTVGARYPVGMDPRDSQ